MKYFFIVTLFFSVTQYVYTQHTLKGQIQNIETLEPVEQASVYFPQLEKGTVSNIDGSFVFNNLPTGSYTLVVSFVGYITKSITVHLPTTKSVNIFIEPTVINIDEVIVSTPFHKLKRENVVKVERKSMAELKTKGASTLAEGITNIVGVENVSTGLSIGKPVIRGLSGNRVLVYTQGIRLENQQFGGEHGLGINDAGIESIEVIKGPSSLLYGSDALGGVIYLNPERFANVDDTQFNINTDYFSNTRGYAFNGGVKTSTKRFKFLSKIAHASHTDFKTGNNNYVTNSRFNEYDFKAGAAYQESIFKTELRYNYNRSILGIPEEVTINRNSDRTPVEPYQKLYNHIVSSKTNVFFEKSNLEITLGYISNIRKEFEEHHHELEEEHEEEHEVHNNEASLDMKLNTLSYNIHYNTPKWGVFETAIGVQGMYQTNENFGEEILIPDANTVDVGTFFISHIHLPKNDIQIGFRFDTRKIDDIVIEGENNEFNRKFYSFNAALGLKSELSDKLISRINIASGFRAPNLAELASNGTHSGVNRFEIGNIDLDNEKNIQTDLAIEYQTKHVEVFVNSFYNKIYQYIFLSPTGEISNGDSVYKYTQEDAELYGGELGIHLHPHPLDWVHLESSFEMVTGKLDKKTYLPLIPANTLKNTLRITHQMDKGVFTDTYTFVTLQNVFNQNNTSDFESRTGGYSLLHLGIGGTINLYKIPLTFRITGNNILNKAYVAHLSRLKSDGIANIGRNIAFGLSISF